MGHQLAQAYRTAKIVVANRLRRVEVPSSPHFDEQATQYFAQRVTQARNYVEYGSGGSTLLAHQHVDCLVSVESDRHFLGAVRRELKRRPTHAETILLPVNIGFTGLWGKPVFTTPTARRLARWAAYPRAPWKVLRRRGIEPDLILVDGRFRVACVLESLLNLGDASPCTILLDDYVSRAEYAAVEEHAELL
jgi:hypothetical protein